MPDKRRRRPWAAPHSPAPPPLAPQRRRARGTAGTAPLPPSPPPPRLSLHKMAARRGHSERRRGDKMAPGGQRGEGRTMGGCGGRGGERGLQPSQERGGGAPPDVRIPSRQAAKALRVKPDLPPFPPHFFSSPPLQKDVKMPRNAHFHSAMGVAEASAPHAPDAIAVSAPPRQHRPLVPLTAQLAGTDP